jgi:DNA-binding transcriptional MocR family regulator
MDRSEMSYHPNRAERRGGRVRFQWLYTLAVKCYRRGSSRPDALANKILVQVAATVLCHRVCQPGEASLARMHGRSTRTIRRAIDTLQAAGLVEVIRRGRKLTNVLRLARSLWARLTNRLQGAECHKGRVGQVAGVAGEVLEAARRAHEAHLLARGHPAPA